MFPRTFEQLQTVTLPHCSTFYWCCILWFIKSWIFRHFSSFLLNRVMLRLFFFKSIFRVWPIFLTLNFIPSCPTSSAMFTVLWSSTGPALQVFPSSGWCWPCWDSAGGRVWPTPPNQNRILSPRSLDCKPASCWATEANSYRKCLI